MAVRFYTLPLTATVEYQLTAAYIPFYPVGVSAAVAADRANIPYRQIIFQAGSAAVWIHNADPANPGGYTLAANATLSLGPFETGPMKFSDFGIMSPSGGDVHVVGVPF